MKMGLPARKMDRHYTYADYRSWPDDERWELIHGEAWNMSAAPSTGHQGVVVDLVTRIHAFLHDGPCRVLPSPVDVFFPQHPDQPEDEVDTVVQPDIVVFCDPEMARPRGVWGAPDWIVEILSPHTSRRDMKEKLELYEQSGVKEYWIVDPGNRYIHVCRLGESGYGEPGIFVEPAVAGSATCPGLEIPLVELFRAASPGERRSKGSP
jgi:Uma2 family endonuclease